MFENIVKAITERNRELIEPGRLHTLLPYLSYDDADELFHNKETTSFVLKGDPIVGASLQDQNQLAEFFRQHTNLPEGCSMQVLLVGSSRVGHILDDWADARIGEKYIKLAKKRVEYFKKKARGEIYPQILDYHLLISMTFPWMTKTPLEVDDIKHIRVQLEQALSKISLRARKINDEEFVQEMSNLLNWRNPLYNEPVTLDPNESLAKQVLSPDQVYTLDENGLYTNENDIVLKTYTARRSPKQWSLAYMDRFLGDIASQEGGLPCPFLMHYGFFVEENQSSAKTKVALRRETQENSLKSKLLKYMPGLDEQLEETNACLKQLAQGERIIKACLSVTLIADAKKISNFESRLKHIWSSCGWEIVPATYDHFPMFLASLPMTWIGGAKRALTSLQFKKKAGGLGHDLAFIGKAKRTITRESQNLIPCLAEWKGHKRPGMLLYGRRGQLFPWSNFREAFLSSSEEQTQNNYNVCIAGQSGSGKSVFMQDMMVTTLGVGGKVFVLDYGRSFKNTCLYFEGQHIEFDIRNPISINPFLNIPTGDSTEEEATRMENLAYIRNIIQVMAAPQDGTSDHQRSILENALRKAWETYGPETTIDNISQILTDSPKEKSYELGEMLSKFCSKGIYGRFFSGRSPVNLSAQLVVIETVNLIDEPDLMAVLVQMMILNINQIMARGDRSKPYLIIIDEAWKLLGGKETGAFIGGIMRTARKNRCGVVLGTQLLTDYFREESPAAKAAFDTSSWKVILFQEANTINAMEKIPELQPYVESPYLKNLLSTVKSNPPYYSEAAIYSEEVKCIIGRLSLDPFSRVMYSTTPHEYTAIQNQLAQGFDMEQAIDRVLEGHR